MNACGDCRMCCKLLGVEELSKPENKMCSHACGAGCRIYEARPATCAKYECVWLQSQDRPDPKERLPMSMRPDNCGVVLDTLAMNGEAVVARVAPGMESKLDHPDVQRLLGIFHESGHPVVIVAGRHRRITAAVART